MSTVPVPPVAAPEVKLAVDVWADLTSAWCYLGKRRLERAITAFEHPHAVRVRYRSFERLWPEGTIPPVTGAGDAYAAALFSPARAKSAAADEGLVLDIENAVPASTFDAHRLMHLGAAEGGLALQAAVAERMFSAHFCEGRALDDPLVLQRVAPEAGLDEHRVAAVLAGDEYAEDVQADQREAVRLQLSAVPFVLADRRIARAGPQPAGELLMLLREAWQAREAGSPAG